MGKRSEPRKEIQVAVRIFGTDSSGAVFSQKAVTINLFGRLVTSTHQICHSGKSRSDEGGICLSRPRRSRSYQSGVGISFQTVRQLVPPVDSPVSTVLQKGRA